LRKRSAESGWAEIDVDNYGDGRADNRFPISRRSNESRFGLRKAVELRRSHQNNLQSALLVRMDGRDRFQMKIRRYIGQLQRLFRSRIPTDQFHAVRGENEIAGFGNRLKTISSFARCVCTR